MAERLLLDTNAVIAFFNGDSAVTERLAEVEVCVPSIVLGELYYGARKSGRVTANLNQVDELANQGKVFLCDTVTAQQYGLIKQRLQVKGQPIPDNDIWIAAVALQNRLTLFTRDRHFQSVDGLSVETW